MYIESPFLYRKLPIDILTSNLVRNFPLQQCNSLHIQAMAGEWLSWSNVDQLREAWSELRYKKVIGYGEGTNVVLCGDVHSRLFVHSNADEIRSSVQGSYIDLEVDAGRNWDSFIDYALAQGWYGLENLKAIPGSCGAAPIQNIGAYGAELADNCNWVEYLDWGRGELNRISSEDCLFRYRWSIFKNNPQWIVCRVSVRCTSDIAIWQQWQQKRFEHTSLHNIDDECKTNPAKLAEVITKMRSQKLPDPKHYPNVGSFFHNPVVRLEDFSALVQKLQRCNAAWVDGKGGAKVSAAWLIDQCAGKGYRRGKCGLSAKHALCLVNYHGASGKEILGFADYIQQKVKEKFGIELMIEPTIVNDSSCK